MFYCRYLKKKIAQNLIFAVEFFFRSYTYDFCVDWMVMLQSSNKLVGWTQKDHSDFWWPDYPYSYRCSTIHAITGLVVRIIVQIILVSQPHKYHCAMQDIPSSNRKDLVFFGSICMIRLLEHCTAHINVVHSLTTWELRRLILMNMKVSHYCVMNILIIYYGHMGCDELRLIRGSEQMDNAQQYPKKVLALWL